MAVHTCDRCNKPATVQLTEISDGKPHDIHLCEACAQEAGYIQQAQHVHINDLLNQFLKTQANVSDPQTARCAECGMTWQEFKDTGLLGCPKDYELFVNQLSGVIERAQQSATHHTGKTPDPARKNAASHDAVKLRQSQLAKLRKELARAVEAESYEAAAKLRDQIRTLEEA